MLNTVPVFIRHWPDALNNPLNTDSQTGSRRIPARLKHDDYFVTEAGVVIWSGSARDSTS